MKPSFKVVTESVLRLFPRLNDVEERISLGLYRLLAKGEPVPADLVAEVADMSVDAVKSTLGSWYGVQRDSAGRVTGYWGLTIAPTRHRLRVDNRTLFTWCAWDTLFLPQLLDATAVVQSQCPVSGDPVSLEISPAGYRWQSDAPLLVSFVLPEQAAVEADVVSSFCCHVHFVHGPAAGERWMARNPGTFLLTLEEAWQLGMERNASRYPIAFAAFARSNA